MPESPEPPIHPTPVTAAPPPYLVKGSRLYQAAAWVVIVAGVVFIVAVIFFAGAAVAWHNQPYRYRHHGMFGPGGPAPGAGQWLFVLPGGSAPPGMGTGGSGGPPMMPMMPGPGGPSMGPGGPGQPPSTPAPPSPPPPPAP